LINPEVVNTIWKYHQFENLNLNTCDQAIEVAMGLLALARREDAGFLTLDRALAREAERQGVRVA
jgi:hypothetical protein